MVFIAVWTHELNLSARVWNFPHFKFIHQHFSLEHNHYQDHWKVCPRGKSGSILLNKRYAAQNYSNDIHISPRSLADSDRNARYILYKVIILLFDLVDFKINLFEISFIILFLI